MRPLIRFVLRTLALLLFRVQVVGSMRSFDTSRLLIVANHESFLDGLLLGLFLPVDPVFIVHTTVMRCWYFRLILSQVDYLAVDTNSPMAMKKVIRLLESGRPVMIFPEGRITMTGSLMKVYDGPAFVAAKTAATVLPVRLDGTARSYFARVTGTAPRQLLPKITLTILPPTQITMPEAQTAKQRRHQAGEAMRRIMQDMLFQSRPQQTLFAALCDAMAIHGRRRYLVEDIQQVEYNYQDLLKMALMLSRLVERAAPDVGPGDRIGLLLPNLTVTLALIFGLSARRRIPAMINYTAGKEGMQAACSAAAVNTIITSRAFVAQANLTDKLAALQNIRLLYLEDVRQTITLADRLWLIGYALWFPRAYEMAISPEEAAVVLFTSGSEGQPKGVVLPHRALLANIAQIRSVIDFSANDKILNALPIFHSFGLTAGSLLPILSGTNLFLYPSPLHYRIIPELAYDRACTILFGTNTFLAHYGKFAHPYDFFRLRYVIAGAEKLSDSVRTLWFEKFGLRIFEGYGATETAPVLSVNTPMAYRTGTVGQFLPGIEYQLEPVPGITQGGLLHVRGPNVMAGYFKVDQPGVLQPPCSAAGAGWYETGDIVELDAEGFVHIVGRVKRFAKISGEMVSLESVEKLAAAASPNHAHAASSRPDSTRGEALVLFTTDAHLVRSALQLKAHESGYPELALPRQIVLLDALPLLGTGKIDYVALKRLAVKESMG
ncbi:MAG: bifunctional acyl-ACP--phospholipid O-acyltransferase/long-chain-fatty-acid--ACP ligase [Magnetococcales bacterium]|nr:bifunctional acyl-ACP--phospholipid O-acyltransferase/long-chain-fatty-acid--ACP ligase [Magnetococcales bacterium]